MDKNKKVKAIIWSVVAVILLAAIILTIVLVVRNNNREKTASAIMQLDTNPSIQLILNENDKVIGEVAINESGEQLLVNVSFMGMKAEVAAETFARVAAEMDKINDSTSSTPNLSKSTKVTITISAEKPEEYEEIANKAKEAVNAYFGENGIFAGAVTSINNDIQGALEKMGANTKDFINLKTNELLAYAKTTASELKEVAISKRDALNEQFEVLYNSILKVADDAFELAKTALENASNLSSETKKELQKAYNSAKAEYDKVKAEFDKKFDEYLQTIQQESVELLNAIKQTAKTAYEQTVAELNTRINEFKNLSSQQQTERKEAIVEFQLTLS